MFAMPTPALPAALPARTGHSRAVAWVIALSACRAHATPTAVVESFLEAESRGRYDDAFLLLAAEDRAVRSLDAWAGEHVQAGLVWLAVAQRAQFSVGDAELTGAGSIADGTPGAWVVVDTTRPEMAAAADLIQRKLGADGARLDPEEIGDQVRLAAGLLAGADLPTRTETVRYALLQQEGDWRVWLGLARQDAAVTLAVQAARAAERGDGAAADAARRALLALPEDPMGGVAALKADAQRALEASAGP
jgi:hypothetical protein